MTEEISAELLESLRLEAQQNANTFALIGKFLFHFSQMEFTIRHRLAAMLNLTDDQFDVITSPYDFAMLCRVTGKIVSQKSPDKQNVVKRLINKCGRLADDRNRVAHGLWTVSDKGPLCRHVSRQNLEYKYYYGDKKELEKLIYQSKELMQEWLSL